MERKTEGNKLVTVMEAAAELGSTRLRVLMLLKEGVLKGAEAGVNGSWRRTRWTIS